MRVICIFGQVMSNLSSSIPTLNSSLDFCVVLQKIKSLRHLIQPVVELIGLTIANSQSEQKVGAWLVRLDGGHDFFHLGDRLERPSPLAHGAEANAAKVCRSKLFYILWGKRKIQSGCAVAEPLGLVHVDLVINEGKVLIVYFVFLPGPDATSGRDILEN